ncbi:hypothetical protein IWW36_004364, partial [Coemansia brasiliensis]
MTTSSSEASEQPDRLPPNAQRPLSVASSNSQQARSFSSGTSRRRSQATELLISGSPPIGTSYIRAAPASFADTDDESGMLSSTGSDMVLPESVAARRLKRHLVTRRPRSGLGAADSQARSYGSVGSGGDNENEAMEDDEEGDTDDDEEEATVDPFKLPSGDITHHLYRWQEEHSGVSS